MRSVQKDESGHFPLVIADCGAGDTDDAAGVGELGQMMGPDAGDCDCYGGDPNDDVGTTEYTSFQLLTPQNHN